MERLVINGGKALKGSVEINGAKKIYGPISTLITVSEEYITALETSLGAGLQHIVVDDEITAKACIKALKLFSKIELISFLNSAVISLISS